MTTEGKKPLIPHRVMLVGEEQIPRQIIQELGDDHMQIFMREPDPREWPEEMQHLIEYLPMEERVVFLVTASLASHNELLRDLLGRWTAAVWEEIGEVIEITPQNRDLIIAEMMRHVGEVVSACARSLQDPDG